ncbi:MAG: nucleoside-diphosphate kinase [Verrucomicrobiae bacterium]|nr:nucleoside-diphosphate kinase [Verrucomicrobiae bacterium]
MPDQLTYVLVNPHTLRKSRTGGVISRLLLRGGCEFVAAQMFAPSRELVQAYAAMLGDFPPKPSSRRAQMRALIREYVLRHYAPDSATGRRQRVMMLLFRGENAVARIREAVGQISERSVTGETIRDTYGDYILGDHGRVSYFEPAVLTPQESEGLREKIELWARFSSRDGGILDNALPVERTSRMERTLVIIKPDNFMFPSGRPGRVIDMFSKTGLYIVGCKVLHMSVAQAEAFYAPVLKALRTKFREPAGRRSAETLSREFKCAIPPSLTARLGGLMAPVWAKEQFEDIVRFMSGRRPSECSPQEKRRPGSEKSLVLIYEGESAVAKVRDVLGPTDPRKAPPGSIRKEFGQDIMVNAAHASDSPRNARREMGIVRARENNFLETIRCFYS